MKYFYVVYNYMDRHMLSPVAERIKAGIRADVEARKSVEGKDD
jgi:hypothetical protein